MFIELAGLPGSGKTTLAKALTADACGRKSVLTREQAVYRGIRARDDGPLKNLLKHLPTAVWGKFFGPETALNEFAALSSTHMEFTAFCATRLAEAVMESELKTSIWRTIARSFIETRLVTSTRMENEWVVMDEAFCQRCFTLFTYMDKPVETATLKTYAGLAPIFELVCWVDTSPETCIERLANRFRGRHAPYELGSRTLARQFAAGQDILSRLSCILETNGVRVIRVSGEAEPEAQLERIKAACLDRDTHP